MVGVKLALCASAKLEFSSVPYGQAFVYKDTAFIANV
jgi:hypothetical protein